MVNVEKDKCYGDFIFLNIIETRPLRLFSFRVEFEEKVRTVLFFYFNVFL